MADDPGRDAGDDAPDQRMAEAAGTPSHPPEATRGGEWLTYRYRLIGADTPMATGTIKAPSFLSAARRLLARRLGPTVGQEPADLRLRAAGELEVLFRVSRTGKTGEDALRVEVARE